MTDVPWNDTCELRCNFKRQKNFCTSKHNPVLKLGEVISVSLLFSNIFFPIRKPDMRNIVFSEFFGCLLYLRSNVETFLSCTVLRSMTRLRLVESGIGSSAWWHKRQIYAISDVDLTWCGMAQYWRTLSCKAIAGAILYWISCIFTKTISCY